MAENETWLAIREGRERRDLRTFELVLAARGIDNRIEFAHGLWRLVVAPEDLSAGLQELGAYERENAPTPPAALPTKIDSGWWGVAGYLAVVWATMICDAQDAFGWNWLAAGRLHVADVAAGEWWRLLTALTLHGDLGHIVANSVFGGLFGLLAGRYLGSGLAWLSIVLGGAIGNALNVLVRTDAFSSIGASTATFAAVGLFGAYMWRSGYFRRLAWRRRGLTGLRAFAPVFAAIAFFAYAGIGDENTDVVAHIAGLVAGFAIGLVIARSRLQLIGLSAQRFCGAAALAAMLLAWTLAI